MWNDLCLALGLRDSKHHYLDIKTTQVNGKVLDMIENKRVSDSYNIYQRLMTQFLCGKYRKPHKCTKSINQTVVILNPFNQFKSSTLQSVFLTLILTLPIQSAFTLVLMVDHGSHKGVLFLLFLCLD